MLAAGAIGAAAAALAILVAPWESSPLATERALAALGEQPVIHAIVENSGPQTTIIDLESGQTSLEAHRTEYWYDEERDLLRARLSVGVELLPGARSSNPRTGLSQISGFGEDGHCHRDSTRLSRALPDVTATRWRTAKRAWPARKSSTGARRSCCASVFALGLPVNRSGRK